jgi:cytochrome c
MEGMTKKLLLLPTVAVLAFPFVHPFGPVREQHSSALLPGVQFEDSRVVPLIEKACQNCHSERTEWPVYSYLPFASWALEKDVAEARQHLNLSHWDQYSAEDKRDLLARIGTEVRNHQMPLPRYLLLHPEARLSEAEIGAIYDWTKAERRALRKNSGE